MNKILLPGFLVAFALALAVSAADERPEAGECQALKAAYAELHGVDVNEVTCGQELLRLLDKESAGGAA